MRRARITFNGAYHHVMNKGTEDADIFKASAKAKDEVIEGIESKKHKFVVGVQFHIEHLWESIPIFKELFVEFVKNT